MMEQLVIKSLRQGAAQAGATAVEGAKQIPSVTQWLVDLVPVNPIKAAADGSLLPVIIFSIALGAALTKVDAKPRQALLDVMDALQSACLGVMRAVLVVAPIGVFCLAFVLAARLGFAAAGALVTYMLTVAFICTLFCVGLLYPAAAMFGRVGYLTFARAIVPAQAVAFSVRSSLAALPAIVWLLGIWLGLSGETAAVAILASGLPTGANVFILANRYLVYQAPVVSSVVASTMLSLGTITLLIAWLSPI